MSPWVGGFAKGRKRAAGMNKLESAYSQLLDEKLARGEIAWRSAHEAIKLRLADKTFLTFDFFVMAGDGVLEAHDCKGGFIPEHNRVKFKTAAELFPLRIILVRHKNKTVGWQYEEV